MTVCRHGQGIVTIDHLLSVSECREYVRRSEETGFEQALVATDLGEQELLEFRNNYRLIVDDPELATLLWQRVREYLPERVDGWIPVSANERLRFYRYDVGQHFEWHSDGCYANAYCDQSKLTYLIYLNERFEGGETCFRISDEETLEILPRSGMALIFPHQLVHKSRVVASGRKYVLRTDVMCRTEQR